MKQSIHYPSRSLTFAVLFLITTGLTVTSCNIFGSDDDENETEYSGTFEPNGTIDTDATGSVELTYNSETGEVDFEVEWQGLTSPVNNMHFHDDGPVIHGIDGWDAATSGSVSGIVTFSAQEAADMAAGDVYVMIHTENFPGGEIRAFLFED